MTHLEFVGPPGSGKSTIRETVLADKSGLYGGTEDGAYRRYLQARAGIVYDLAVRMLPPRVRSSVLEHVVKYRCNNEMLRMFVFENLDLVEFVTSNARTLRHEPERAHYLAMNTFERYQLCKQTANRDETVCLDESFAQLLMAFLWRQPSDTFSIAEYLELVPTPALVIHVDPPTRICLERQRERGRIYVEKQWFDTPVESQSHLRECCSAIAEGYRTHTDASVITVENTGHLDDSVDRVRESLE